MLHAMTRLQMFSLKATKSPQGKKKPQKKHNMFIVPEIWSKLIRKLVEVKMYLPVIIGRRMAYKGGHRSLSVAAKTTVSWHYKD